MSGWLDFGHPHATDGDFQRAHGYDAEHSPPPTVSALDNPEEMTDGDFYRTYGYDRANPPATSTAKTISMQMAAGMIVGVLAGTIVVSGVLMKSKSLGFKSNMNRNSLAVRSSAVAGAIAVPAYLYAMNR